MRLLTSAANISFSSGVCSSASVFFCCSLEWRVDCAISSAKKTPSETSLVLATAVTRCTLAWMELYQSATTRSLASGRAIISADSRATAWSCHTPTARIEAVRTMSTPKAMASRAPMLRF